MEHRRQLHNFVENISIAIGKGLTGAVISRKMVISIGNDVLKEREIGRRTNRKIQQKNRPLLVGKELLAKIKEAIIRIRLTGTVISQKMVISIGGDVLKANDPNSLLEFGG